MNIKALALGAAPSGLCLIFHTALGAMLYLLHTALLTSLEINNGNRDKKQKLNHKASTT